MILSTVQSMNPRGNSRSKEANSEAVRGIQSRDIGGLDLTGHCAVGEKRSRSGCILK